MNCESEIRIFDKKTNRFLGYFICPGADQCFKKNIWGISGDIVRLGVDGLAARLSGLSQDQISASFDSRCLLSDQK
jgi:hypothetical protein